MFSIFNTEQCDLKLIIKKTTVQYNILLYINCYSLIQKNQKRGNDYKKGEKLTIGA